MNPKKFALISGIFFLVMGVLAFVPGLYSMPADGLPFLKVEESYGLFLGIFAMNIFNKLALIAFGVWGILASQAKFTSLPKSIAYSRATFVVMGVASILGMFSATNTLFGYWPLFGNEIWFHGVFALMGAYFGYALTSEVHPSNQEPPKRTRLDQPLHDS